MAQDALWIGRFRHRKTRSLCSVRVQDTERLPDAQSLVQVIADPFADPEQDAVELAQRAPILKECSLEALRLDYEAVVPLRPGKIIGVGRNFADHAKELKNEVPKQPLLFFKPPTALLLDGHPLHLPTQVGRIDMEAELVVVIGKPGVKILKDKALEHIGGLVMGNDISARDLQKSQPRWVRAKGGDGFAPLGQWIRVSRQAPPSQLRVQGWRDGERVQDAPIANFVFDIPTLIADISRTMTLEAGDLIFTGTPAGVSPLTPGVETRVEAQGMCLSGVRTPVIGA